MVNRRLAREWLWYVGSIPIAMVFVGWAAVGSGELSVYALPYFFLSLLYSIPIYASLGSCG